ncbi:DUF292-domain-containing protein [Exidia glandulosa HHB12029]|uniref:DUF292-domain-containing protein n=1 Tax=Exidia glandulosa HHB12029 TaxID=1314781 RepID=A0A165NBK7_EXIGL|nr:DUF292-domain-containing protein [Exidia glandulosa HHB12029]
MPATWNATRTKVQLRLAVQRLRILQEKKAAMAKAARREIATMLERGKIETARIKVEGIINEDVYLELLELMELYCELLISRFGLLDMSTREPDPGVAEGVNAIIHAAPRTELKELHVLREMLMHKFGREYSIAVMENRDNCVTERVVAKLTVAMPPPELVDAYLHEIAKGYGIPWHPPGYVDPSADGDDDDDEGGDGGGLKVGLESPLLSEPPSKKVADDLKDLAPGSGLRLPDIPPTEGEATPKPDAAAKKKAPEDELAELTKRFEALKKFK